jgi:hypothetical protein
MPMSHLDMYSVGCTVVADVKSAVKHLPRQTGRNGREYFVFSHEVQLLFGLTEHMAHVSWKERVSAVASSAKGLDS